MRLRGRARRLGGDVVRGDCSIGPSRRSSAIVRPPVLSTSISRAVSLVALCLAALVVAAGAAAGSPRDGAYRGVVGPGYPLHFSVSDNGKLVSGLVLSFDETCNGAPGLTPPVFRFPAAAIMGDSFSAATTDHFGSTASDALRIAGRLSDGKATGEVTSVSAIKSLKSCTETEPFSARLG
jgi:hypothetical protein